MVPGEDESVSRDLERAEEYEETVARSTVLAPNKYQLSTGVIIAARYADKLRRVALVALGKMVPKEVIIRDIAELNKELYHEIVEKRKLGKLDLVRITVTLRYDEQLQKLVFEDVKISTFIDEEKCRSMYEGRIDELEKELGTLKKENEELKAENERLKAEIQQIKELVEKLT